MLCYKKEFLSRVEPFDVRLIGLLPLRNMF